MLKRRNIKRAPSSSGKIEKVLRYRSQSEQLPEDILASSSNIFHEYNRKKPIWKRKRFHFAIGLSVGLLAAAYGASTTPTAQTHFSDLQAYLADQLSEMDLASMFPTTTDIVDELLSNVTSFFTPAPSNDQSFMPALTVGSELDLKPHYPVVLIPGIISSGLESWGTAEKSRRFFRKRMWGTTTMFRSVLLDKEVWTNHMKLDPITGLDPPDVKIRAAQGLDAADYFVTGFWIWAKIIENLAMIGYDNSNMYLASYDWRLSFSNLEIRDKYFSKLQSMIETSHKTQGEPAVIVTHSMGSCLFPYFLRWVQSEEGGNGGEDWADKHIASFVNIAGPMVGVPKALTAMLSGETRDTISLGSFGAYLLEKFFSRRERANLMRSWAGGSSMLPKGGDAIWGNQRWAPDDEVNSRDHSYGNILSFSDTQQHEPDMSSNSSDDILISRTSEKEDHIIDQSSQHLSVDSSFELLHQTASREYGYMLNTNYSFGISTSKKQLEKNNKDPRKWSSPLESQLPIAPNMKIYCMYGVGLPTERSYYYTKSKYRPSSVDNDTCDANDKNKMDVSALLNGTDIKKEEFIKAVTCSNRGGNNSEINRPPSIYIDAAISDPLRGTETGVRFADGDGTVPVLSLGYMCTPSGGWTKHADLYNPGHSPVVLKEYLNEESESKLDVRGGPKAGDHVDILGNWEMTLDILKIASGKGDDVSQRIISNIENYAQNIYIQPKD